MLTRSAPSPSPRARGQSLVLACLYVLLLVVMVLMTLGISKRVREKVELNTLAEATAYSNAVATARTYNAIALMNRAAIAHWINLAGVESLISWTGLVIAGFVTVYDILSPPAAYQGSMLGYTGLPGYNPPNVGCTDAMANLLGTALHRVFDDMHVNWGTFLDDVAKAGKQGRRLQDAIGSLKDAEAALLDDLRARVGNHQIGRQIAFAAKLPEVSALGGSDGVNGDWLGAPRLGGDGERVWWAVMDARSEWVKNRHNDPIAKLENALQQRFTEPFTGSYDLANALNNTPNWERVRATGSIRIQLQSKGHGCFGADFDTCEQPWSWTNALAEDEITARVTVDIESIDHVANLNNGRQMPNAACPPYRRPTVTRTNKSRVMASDIHHDDDFAIFDLERFGAGLSEQIPSVAHTMHTMGPCTDNFALQPCHSVYVNIVGLNHGAPLSGQAKNYASFSRTSGPSDPWELKLTFAFNRNSPGTKLDLKKPLAATAVGTGLAYYHRRGAFSETPNLFNPYWRATLVGAKRGVDDLSGLPPGAAAAWNALKGLYRGED